MTVARSQPNPLQVRINSSAAAMCLFLMYCCQHQAHLAEHPLSSVQQLFEPTCLS